MFCVEKKTNRSFRMKEPSQISTASLSPTISLAIGARVMLCVNVDVSDGLSNGRLGTIIAIIKGSMSLGQPEAVCIKFYDVSVGINSRRSQTLPHGVDITATTIKVHDEIIQAKTISNNKASVSN